MFRIIISSIIALITNVKEPHQFSLAWCELVVCEGFIPRLVIFFEVFTMSPWLEQCQHCSTVVLSTSSRSGQVSHLWFSSNICAFLSRIFEGMYMSCKLASSLADFNVNFGTSTLRGMLQSTLPSLGSNFCLLFFSMH